VQNDVFFYIFDVELFALVDTQTILKVTDRYQ